MFLFKVMTGHPRKTIDVIEGGGSGSRLEESGDKKLRSTTWAVNQSNLCNGSPKPSEPQDLDELPWLGRDTPCVSFPIGTRRPKCPDSVGKEQQTLCICNTLGSPCPRVSSSIISYLYPFSIVSYNHENNSFH